MLVQADAPALQEAGREEVEVPPDIGLDGVGYGWRQGGRFNGRHRLSGSQDGLFVQLVDLAVGSIELQPVAIKGNVAAGHHHRRNPLRDGVQGQRRGRQHSRSEEHTSELQSLMRISYAVFCLKKKKLEQT